MASIRLDQRCVDAPKSRNARYDVRDRGLKGFGVRILPSGGKRYFIDSQHEGRRIWKFVGSADDISTGEARSRARSILAAMRSGGDTPSDAASDIPFEAVAEEVFRRYARNWKSSLPEILASKNHGAKPKPAVAGG